jgi:hypothetical protein
MARKGIVIGLGLIAVIVSVIGLSNSYNNLKNANQEKINACADLKNAIAQERAAARDVVAASGSLTNLDEEKARQSQENYNRMCT